jgi:UDP-4-amino-4,6-dideoxy-N-acetyl-beta-L-altrosamine N-acetyltransferase
MPKRDDYNLRPMINGDLDLVLRWRNSDRIRENMYTNHIISQEEHRTWFERESSNQRSHRLIFEYLKRPIGVVNFTDIDFENHTCRWGFYIGATDAPLGSGSAMGFSALEWIFEQFDINQVMGEVLAFNEDSLRFHKRLGFKEKIHSNVQKLKRGRVEDVIHLVLTLDDWNRIRPGLVGILFISDSEK